MTVDREMLIDAIMGAQYSMESFHHMTQAGLAKFTGNQWNEAWSKDRAAISLLTDEQLVGLYSHREPRAE